MLTRTEKFKEYRESIKNDTQDEIITSNTTSEAPSFEKEVGYLKQINKEKNVITTIYVGLIVLIVLGLIVAGVIIF